MSLAIDDTLEVIRVHLKDNSTLLNAIAKDLIKAEKEIAAAKSAENESDGPKMKNRFVVLIRSDDSETLKPLVAAGAFILAVPDDDQSIETYSGEGLIGRIATAARNFNETMKRKKGQRTIRTFVSAMSGLKTKAIKNSGSNFLIKTKIPVEVVVVDKENIV